MCTMNTKSVKLCNGEGTDVLAHGTFFISTASALKGPINIKFVLATFTTNSTAWSTLDLHLVVDASKGLVAVVLGRHIDNKVIPNHLERQAAQITLKERVIQNHSIYANMAKNNLKDNPTSDIPRNRPCSQPSCKTLYHT